MLETFSELSLAAILWEVVMAVCLESGVNPWYEDQNMKEDLKRYVQQNLKRKEILDCMKLDYAMYTWSISTLARRLKYFDIHYIDWNVALSAVTNAVKKELEGPGKLLGYRAMNQKPRTEHGICVPRRLVCDVMFTADPQGMEARSVKKKRNKPKQPFMSNGPNWTLSLDGHDKLMGFQNCTFPIAIYGCLDTFSRKILFLKVWDGNSDPKIIGNFYLQYLVESKTLPCYLRLDRGTETGVMGSIQCFLRQHQGDLTDPTDAIIYGPSTSNKIERWWRDLHERMEKDIKAILLCLLESHTYDPTNERDRKLMSYLFIPVVQRECDLFVKIWNSHRIRQQHGLQLPAGIPNHLYAFPEQYGAMEKGIPLSEADLVEVAELSGLASSLQYLTVEDQFELCQILPEPEKVCCKDLIAAFKFLKNSEVTL